MPEEYLLKVHSLAEDALVQTGAVRHCEHHKDVLLFDSGVEGNAYNLASIWLKDEVGTFPRQDLEEAIKGILERAIKNGCPECARQEDN